MYILLGISRPVCVFLCIFGVYEENRTLARIIDLWIDKSS